MGMGPPNNMGSKGPLKRLRLSGMGSSIGVRGWMERLIAGYPFGMLCGSWGQGSGTSSDNTLCRPVQVVRGPGGLRSRTSPDGHQSTWVTPRWTGTPLWVVFGPKQPQHKARTPNTCKPKRRFFGLERPKGNPKGISPHCNPPLYVGTTLRIA